MTLPAAAAQHRGARTDHRLRVLVDGRVLDDRYHGIGRVTEAILREFARRGDIAITLALRPQQHGKRFAPHKLAAELGFDTVGFDHDVAAKMQCVAWPGLLRRLRPDVAFFPYSLAAPVIGGTPSFTVVHDCILEADRHWSPNRRVRLLYRAMTALSVRHNQVITPTAASAAAVKAYYRISVPAGHIVQWGVDPSFGALPDAEPPTLTSVQGQPLPSRFFLHVGARRPHKNVRVLVEALAARRLDEHLVLVGSVDPRFPDPVPQLAERLGVGDRVHHFRHVTDAELTSLYRQAEAFTYPSLMEGVGLPLLEAMTAGVPVVASDIPVFREVAGEAALFVPPTDAAAWAAALGRVRTEPELTNTLIDRGQEVASAANWSETARALADLFRREVANPNL